ncbi:MAG: MnmC family methyltransferase [Cyanobacteria bacterium P01_H01_bin.74]
MFMQNENYFVQTRDGSLTIKDDETGEYFHNKAGAYTEALTHYASPLVKKLSLHIPRVLDQRLTEVVIIDACYGLGYNTWGFVNTVLKTKLDFLRQARSLHENQIRISVFAIEKAYELLTLDAKILIDPLFYPLNTYLTQFEHNTYYRTFLEDNISQHADDSSNCRTSFIKEIPNSSCVENSDLNRTFIYNNLPGITIELHFMVGDLRSVIQTIDAPIDAIFHDPFSPQCLPELWTLTLFHCYFNLLKSRFGGLYTYSSAASVRGAMQRVGFQIFKTSGLGKKSGGTVGRIPGTLLASDDLNRFNLTPLSEAERKYIQSKAGLPYEDNACLNASREIIIANRKAAQASSNRPSGKQYRSALNGC